MRKRVVVLGIALVVIAAGSVSYVVAGTQLYGRYHLANANYTLDAVVACGALVAWSPPRILYSGFYANQPTLVTIRYRSATPQILRISISIPRFTQEQTIQVQAAPGFQSQTFKPPLLGTGVLDSVIGSNEINAQLHLRIQTAGGTACDTSAPVVLMSRQWMHWSDPATGDNSAYLAGWITPEAPAILDLIGRTDLWIEQHPAAYPAITALRGYDSGNARIDEVREEVNALFDTLQSVYHVHYASDNLVYGQDQRIRLPQDVLSTRTPTAMCVETTAILASAVEHLGMRPYVIIVPGHAFLGVGLGADAASPIDYWETSDLNGGVSGSQANVNGDDEFATDAQQGIILRVLDVEYERAHGIEPIE